MDNFQQPNRFGGQNWNFLQIDGSHSFDMRLFEACRLQYINWYYSTMLLEGQQGEFKPITIKAEEEPAAMEIKNEEIPYEEEHVFSQNGGSGLMRKARIHRGRRGGKLKKRRKENDRSTQKNLLVHLKLWLEKFIEEKGRVQPIIKKQFQRIFANNSRKPLREVYMNLGLLQRVLQHEVLRPCLRQFFEHRILRYLMSSNIQNKICIVKYVPLLLKKYMEGRCQSLKS